MRILFILDPLEKLDPEWDTSLTLLREFAARRHTISIADTPDLWACRQGVMASTRKVSVQPGYRYHLAPARTQKLSRFDLILARKEPPFDSEYINMTYLLEQVSDQVVVSNHPRGIRDTNEKLGILYFSKWIPRTIVSASPARLLEFRKSLGGELVVKPLDQKGGIGVTLLPRSRAAALPVLEQMTRQGSSSIMGQEFLRGRKVLGDKRILILDGKILCAYEKRFKRGEFRANLSLGATYHACTLNSREKRLVADMRPYLRERGIHLAGVDVMKEKLIEVNVTCPAGIAEARSLYEDDRLIKRWADSLERKIRP